MYERGVFAWVCRILFWCFNILMVLTLLISLVLMEPQNDHAVIGMGLWLLLLLVLWVIGFIILGGLMVLTRTKVIVTSES